MLDSNFPLTIVFRTCTILSLRNMAGYAPGNDKDVGLSIGSEACPDCARKMLQWCSQVAKRLLKIQICHLNLLIFLYKRELIALLFVLHNKIANIGQEK